MPLDQSGPPWCILEAYDCQRRQNSSGRGALAFWTARSSGCDTWCRNWPGSASPKEKSVNHFGIVWTWVPPLQKDYHGLSSFFRISANQQPSKLLDVLVLALGQNLGKTDSRKDSYCLIADYFMITVYDSLFRVLPTLFSSLQLDVLSSWGKMPIL